MKLFKKLFSYTSILFAILFCSIRSSEPEYEVPEKLRGHSWSSDEGDQGYPPPPQQDQYIPPPPPLPTANNWETESTGTGSSSNVSMPSICQALYTYSNANMEDNNIPMEEGEEFIVVDDDVDGWTRVKRLNPIPGLGDEGFVPTTWIRMIR